MKHRNRINNNTLSIVLILSFLLAIFTGSDFSSIDIIKTNDAIASDELVSVSNAKGSIYSYDEVVIMLADNEQTEAMQFYSIYSDDYTSINEDAYQLQNSRNSSNIHIAESTNVISSQLNLGVDFTEMKLLNPSSQTTANGLYTIGDTNNNIFSLKLDDISVEEALEILNSNPAIEIAEPNYLYELCGTPNDIEYDTQYALEKNQCGRSVGYYNRKC